MKPPQPDALLKVLQARFDANMARHVGIAWQDARAQLDLKSKALDSLSEMERTGGEPDVVERDARTGEIIFFDCAAESPSGRRSLCYDRAALDARKENKPAGCATEMASAMGIALLTEAQYRHLQTFGVFDIKSSSWINTPNAIRSEGGALFCDRRYNHVFTYHNGVQSYYAARGFRGVLRV